MTDRRSLDLATGHVVVLMPVFNDWVAATDVVRRLDRVAGERSLHMEVVLVDDGSTDVPALPGLTLERIQTVRVLGLLRNVGHQRAIAIGLAYVAEQLDPDVTVIMDADGQDLPEQVPALLDRLVNRGNRIVFAERQKRPEGLVFRLGYWLYRVLHLGLTGIRVRVGNFSVVPRTSLRRLTVVSELWNHYAAAVFASRIPYETIPLPRGPRLGGRSTMRLLPLVVHGFSAIAVHSERVAVRLLLVSGAALIFVVLAMLVLWLRIGLTATSAIAWMALLLALGVLLQALFASVALLASALHRRSTLGFIPSRDHRQFVDGVTIVVERATTRPATVGRVGS